MAVETKTTHIKTANIVPDGDVNEEQFDGDISLEEYLREGEDRVTGKVRVRGGFLKVSSITEEELDRLQKMAERPDPKNGKGAVKFEPSQFKKLLAAKGLALANPTMGEMQIMPMLNKRLAGDVTIIAEAITKLSGFSEDRQGEIDDLLGFSN